MQRRTRTQVLGHHSPSARTPSSVSFNGLKLGLKLELERKLKRAVQQTKMIIRALIVIDLSAHQLARDETNGSLTSSVNPRFINVFLL